MNTFIDSSILIVEPKERWIQTLVSILMEMKKLPFLNLIIFVIKSESFNNSCIKTITNLFRKSIDVYILQA